MLLKISSTLIVVLAALGFAAAQDSDQIQVVLPRDEIPATGWGILFGLIPGGMYRSNEKERAATHAPIIRVSAA